MNFYIKCEYITRLVSPLFKNMRCVSQLIDIAIACENGANYYAVSSEFDAKYASQSVLKQLPSKSLWKKLDIIRQEIEQFIFTQSAEAPIELYAWAPEGQFYLVKSFLIIPHSPQNILGLKTFDISQTFYEFVGFVHESYFGPQLELSLEQKMELFFSDPACPPMAINTNSLTEVVWLRAFNDFLEKQKANYFLPDK